MSYKVGTTLENALILLTHRGRLFSSSIVSDMEQIIAEIIVDEKGYPLYTSVHIDALSSDVDMVLVVEPDGSWELV